jgi:hypothetical protein
MLLVLLILLGAAQVAPCRDMQVHSSPGDTLSLLKTFIAVCQGYQRLPLQLDMDMRHSTNLMTSPDDTLSQSAVFYLSSWGSCIRFGEVEQLSTDSLMIIVSHRLKRIIIYRNTGSVESLLARFVALPMKDSSLALLQQRYKVTVPDNSDDTARLVLQTRQAIYGSRLPKDEIRVLYNKTTQMPWRVEQLHRSLVEMSPEAWKSFAGAPGWEDKLVRANDSTCFVIKELQTVYSYRHIAHEPGKKPPVSLADRIIAEAPGRWRGVAGYEDYQIITP